MSHAPANKQNSPYVFRLRSTEITRIEGLSDAVFGFAVTLLIVSLEVPRTYSELSTAMRGFLPFAICFAMLIELWYKQHTFFRRYGLQDGYTVFLNATLLFTVLFYVYPLKFMFTMLVNQLLRVESTVTLPDGSVKQVLENWQAPQMMLIFGAGLIAVSLMFALMYWHAWRQRERLELNELERLDTKESIGVALINIAVGVISILVSWRGGPQWTGAAGMVYPIGFPVLLTTFYTVMGNRRRKLRHASLEQPVATRGSGDYN